MFFSRVYSLGMLGVTICDRGPPSLYSYSNKHLAVASPPKRIAFFKTLQKYSLFIDLNLSYRKMFVIFFNIGFFLFFPKNVFHWGLKVHDSLIFVYFS